ncbi:hypothetical protein [Campylobacter sp.]|uniref:hypothetical protein n=1 Tax=Campylobacter sp. TaxID=205 RepID=UPI0026FAE749|nr:hypothetical protein [Campylobacter sp.]
MQNVKKWLKIGAIIAVVLAIVIGFLIVPFLNVDRIQRFILTDSQTKVTEKLSKQQDEVLKALKEQNEIQKQILIELKRLNLEKPQ